MRRWLLILLVLSAFPLQSAILLYLKDGSHQRVREYEVKTERVRYYSLERSEWEEVPLDLIDLKRTQAEEAAAVAELKAETATLAAEDKAERAQAAEVRRVPQNPGVYWINGENLVTLKQAEAKVVKDKKRSILKVLSPIPLIAGKSTLELDGTTAAFVVTSERPEFYFRLAEPERFGIAKLTRQKETRLVEKWSILPVTKEMIQEHTAVEVFRHQVGDGLYKIWPQKEMEPGEYALLEWTEGKGNTQVWDFSLRAAGKP